LSGLVLLLLLVLVLLLLLVLVLLLLDRPARGWARRSRPHR
jgi:hypothetical protein